MFSKTTMPALGALAVLSLVGSKARSEAQTLTHMSSTRWQMAQNNNFPNSVNGRPLENAPVPNVTDSRVAPADRAGTEASASQASGPVGSTPFSGAPQSDRATATPQARIEPDANGSNVTPRLTK